MSTALLQQLGMLLPAAAAIAGQEKQKEKQNGILALLESLQGDKIARQNAQNSLTSTQKMTTSPFENGFFLTDEQRRQKELAHFGGKGGWLNRAVAQLQQKAPTSKVEGFSFGTTPRKSIF